MVNTDDPFYFKDGNLIWIRNIKGADSTFLGIQLRRAKTEILGGAIGSSQKALTIVVLKNLRVALPPPREQRAIAEALGDVDALLGALEKLIAKKRDLKQAAMQQLLTGKKRLPGFSGEWELKRLGDVVEIFSGGTPRTNMPAYWDGGIKWCTPTDITGTAGKYLTETERTISQAGLQSCSAQLLPVGTLLLCSRATIGELRIAACDVCTNQGFKSLVTGKTVNNEFLYYLLLTMKPQMVERAIGSTFLEISKRDTSAIEVSFPSIPEQVAIATVLSDMDVEIAALEQRLAKTRALKQGMMQELLTGRTRLVGGGDRTDRADRTDRMEPGREKMGRREKIEWSGRKRPARSRRV